MICKITKKCQKNKKNVCMHEILAVALIIGATLVVGTIAAVGFIFG
ncbi:MAG: hypothetical protein AABX38_01205 [Candidatus Micrarchaeota archaeon]